MYHKIVSTFVVDLNSCIVIRLGTSLSGLRTGRVLMIFFANLNLNFTFRMASISRKTAFKIEIMFKCSMIFKTIFYKCQIMKKKLDARTRGVLDFEIGVSMILRMEKCQHVCLRNMNNGSIQFMVIQFISCSI